MRISVLRKGLSRLLNLMEAQTAWVSARSSLIDAQIEVKLTEVYLARLWVNCPQMNKSNNIKIITQR